MHEQEQGQPLHPAWEQAGPDVPGGNSDGFGNDGARIQPGVGIDTMERDDRLETTVGRNATENGEKLKEFWPRIYVASLSDYNAGRLHGAWIEAAQDPEALGAEIAAMLERSPERGAEEWAIHDFEEFGPVRLSEYESLERISAVAQGLEEHGKPFGFWANHAGADLDRLRNFEQAYLGRWDSMASYGEQVMDDLGLDEQLDAAVPQGLRPYVHVDYEQFGEDVATELVVETDSEGVWLFDANA